jgi:hypothetical protein
MPSKRVDIIRGTFDHSASLPMATPHSLMPISKPQIHQAWSLSWRKYGRLVDFYVCTFHPFPPQRGLLREMNEKLGFVTSGHCFLRKYCGGFAASAGIASVSQNGMYSSVFS